MPDKNNLSATLVAGAVSAVAGASKLPSYVVHGATIQCSCGLRLSNVVLRLSHGEEIRGMPRLNIGDCKANENILPFGGCRSPENPLVQEAAKEIIEEVRNRKKGFMDHVIDIFCRKPSDEINKEFIGMCAAECFPAIGLEWTGGKEDVLVGGMESLLDNCTITCMYGGKIRILDDGQKQMEDKVMSASPDPVDEEEQDRMLRERKLEAAAKKARELSPGTINRINYLMEKINTVEEGEKVWERMDCIGLWYEKEDYERELDRLLDSLQDPDVMKREKIVSRVAKSGEGVLQGVGGVTEALTGLEMVSKGWLGGPQVVGMGGYMVADGASNVVEGIHKVGNAIRYNPYDQTWNPLRDNAFEPLLGEEGGEEVYNTVTLGVGIFCITKGVVDLKSTKGVAIINRRSQIEKAQRLGIQAERKVIEVGDKLVIVTQEANAATDTPMILQKTIVDPKKLGKEILFIDVDVTNTSLPFTAPEDNCLE